MKMKFSAKINKYSNDAKIQNKMIEITKTKQKR